MTVRRVDPSDRTALRRFVALERKLWRHEPLYWSEFDADLVKRLSGRSAFNREMDHALLLLVDASGTNVGRAVAYLNRRWQRQHNDQSGFIGNLCFAPGLRHDEAGELLGAAEEWIRQQGATGAICGIDGTGALGMGILVADHDASPMYPIKWHPPEYAHLITAVGYSPTRSFWSYVVDFASPLYRAMAARALNQAECEVRPIDRRRWKDEVELVRHIFNETFANEWEMNEYTQEEFIETWGQMKWFLDPHTWLIAEVDGEPAGFCVGLPDITPLVRSFNGRIGPAKFIRLLRGVKTADRRGLFVVGVRTRFRRRHIAQTLACRVYRHYERSGLTSALYYWVDDENLASRGVAESLGAEGNIILRCYHKAL